MGRSFHPCRRCSPRQSRPFPPRPIHHRLPVVLCKLLAPLHVLRQRVLLVLVSPVLT